MILKRSIYLLITILAFGLQAQSTFTVTNTNDSGSGSLRQAITDANAASGAAVIDMTNISGTILLESALPQINGDLTLNGPGEELLSVSGQDLYRPFFVNAGTVNLNNFSIVNGLAKGGDGGTNFSGGGGGAGMGGGLIANSNVDLTLEFITFSNNQAVGGNGGGAPNFSNQARPGSAGGSGPFHGATAPSGRNGSFGSGGSSGAILLLPSQGGNTSGGNGGYGAGAGGGGTAVLRESEGTPIPAYPGGTGGKFGGNGGQNSDKNNDGGKEGGGGAGLGGAVFSRADAILLKNVSFIDNTAVGGETYTAESFANNNTTLTSRGQGKGGALFIYSEIGDVPSYTIDGMVLSGNDAQDANASDTDNDDIYLEEGLSFVDNTVFAVSRTNPMEGGNYTNGQPINFWFNREIYTAGGVPMVATDIESAISFTNSALENITFSVDVEANNVSITPLESLVPNETYTVNLNSTFYDRDNFAISASPIQFEIDTNEPSFVSTPANNQEIQNRSFQLTANELIVNLDGSAIQDADISSLVEVKLDDENGALVPFSGSIVGSVLMITITEPIANQTYFVSVNNVEDLAGNERTFAETFSILSPAGLAFTSDPASGGVLGKRLFSITADEGLFDLEDTPLTSADLAGKLTLKENDMNGADVSFDAFLEGNSIYIATNQLANASTYWVSLQGIEDITGIEIAQQEFTFTTTDLFNPVSGSGHAVSFTGGQLDITSIDLTGDFTLEAWIKTTDSDGMILGNATQSNLGFGIESGKLSFNNAAQSVSSTTSINDGMLHHVAMTNTAGTIALYIDGVLDGTGSVTVEPRTITAVANGYMGSNPSQLTADIDEVRIWNAAVGATDIASYQAVSLDESHPSISDLVALFAFDESRGQYALDYNGSLVNGILSGDYSWKISEVVFPAAQFELSVDGQVIPLEGTYDMGSVVINQSSAPKVFQIENTGTSDLLLRGNPFVGITGSGAAQFSVNESSTASLLAPGATTTFAVSYSPTIPGLNQAELVIENGSINDPFKISVQGIGLDITTSGNWQLVRGRPGAFPVSPGGGAGIAVYNDELYTTSISSDGSQQGLFKLVGEDLTFMGSFNRSSHLYASSGGIFFSTTKSFTGGMIFSAINSSGTYSFGTSVSIPDRPSGASTTYESSFDMAFDSQNNSFVVYASNFIAPSSFNAATAGLYVKKILQGGVGLTDYAQLSTQELKPASYLSNQNIYSYDIAVDGSDNLWVVSRADRYDLFLSKYTEANDTWMHYDLTSDLIGTYFSNDLKMEIDADDNIHIVDKAQSDNKLKYLKVASNGTVLISDEYQASIKTSDDRVELAIGTDNNAIIVYVDEATRRLRAIKYENGAFADFRDTFVSNDMASSGSLPISFTVDPSSGKAYLGYQSEVIYGNSIVTTAEIVPELTIAVEGKQLGDEASVRLQSGVGYEKAITLTISNEGQSIVNFTGEPILTGDNAGDLDIDLEDLPTSLFPGESVDVPVSFTPVGVYDSEVTLAIPSNATGTGSEVSFQLKGLDDTNTGNWILYTDTNLSALNSRDMTLYNGEPIWVTNRIRNKGVFQNPNRGNQSEQLYTVQLELFDASSTNPIAVRDYFSNDVNASPTLLWDDFYLNQFQNLKIEIDPALGLPTLITNGVNGVSSYVPNDDGGYESLTREGYNEFGDLVFDDSNEFYYLKLESSNLVIRRGINNSYVVSFSGLSNPNTDMDMEAYGDDLYFTYADNTSLQVRRIASDAATNSGMTTLLSASDVRFSQASQSKTKDLEFSNEGLLYLAYIVNSTGNVAVKTYDEVGTSWTDLPTLDLSSTLSSATDIQDMQLEIHPDGSPYISIVYDVSTTQGVSIVYRLEGNTWVQQSSANFVTYGGTSVSDSPTGHVALNEPNLKTSVLEISDEGTIYWLSGFKLNMMIPTPEAFDKAPSFTTSPSASTVEETALFSYDIVVDDADAGDAITITAVDVPSWLTFTDNGDRTASLVGTPSDDDVAEYTITLIASDGRIEVTQEVMLEVTNINDDPDFFIEDITYFIDQNDQGTIIDITGVTDGDEGVAQTLTFSVTSDNTALISNPVVSYTAGESSATLSFSHNQAENGDAFLTVRLEDEGSLFKEQVVRVNVVEGQVFFVRSEPSGFYDEDIEIGTAIGTLFASDVDFDETYTFSFASGVGDNFNDLFTITDNTVFTAAELDFESNPTPTFRFQGDNGAGTVYENFAVISLRDVNDAPTDFALSNLSIDEGLALGTTVGTFSATDQDSGNTYVYTLVTGFGDNASFQIVEDELQVAEVFDFDDKSSYSIQVELDDSGLSLVRDFTIAINNINVAPSSITISNASTPENGFADVLIGALSTVDSDDDDTHTYSLVGGTTSLESEDVKLIGNELYTNRSFDFETEQEILVEVRSIDNGQESVTQTLTITVEDVNDVPVGISLSTNAVQENVSVGSLIATVSVSDPDIDDTHTLTLVQGYEENYAVSIDGLNILSAIPLDHEVLASLELQLLVEDAAGGLNQFEVVVDVADVNEAPTELNLSNASISEDAPIGSVIGVLSTTDQDVGDSHVFEVLTSIEVAGETIFPVVVDGTNLVTTVPLDFETLRFLDVEIEVEDQGGLTFKRLVTLETLDVNEAPTSMTLNANTIAENTAVGVRIGQLIAVDPDVNDALNYSLVAGEGDEDNAFFQIGGAGNELENAVIFDFESRSTYSVRARATDEAGLFYEEAFTITVVDGNDQPTAISLSSSEVNEDATIGTVVGTLATTDEDAGDQHTYEVLAINDREATEFTIDGSNLVTAANLDFETTATYSVVVEATDSQGLTWPETFEITVIDVNEGSPQTITFEPLAAKVFGDTPFELEATASSELAVSYTSSNPEVATISGSTVSIVGAGETVITATQAGDASFAAADPVIQTLIINKADQTLDYQLEDKVTADEPFEVVITANSGLPVSVFVENGPASISENIITLSGEAGIVELMLSQVGNNNYNAVSEFASFVVTDASKQDQVITFELPAVVYRTDQAIALEATSDAGLDVTFEIVQGTDFATISNGLLEFVAPGVIVVAASNAGNENFNPASVTQTVEIKPVFSLSGVITAQGNTFDGGELLAVGGSTNETYSLAVGESGAYTLDDLKDGEYYLVVNPSNTADYYATYYGDVIFWEDATRVTVVDQNLVGIDVAVQAKDDGNLMTGNGVITGRVIEGDDEGARLEVGRILEGTAIPDVSVFLIRISDDQLMTEVITDANGDFLIQGIPEGAYRLKVELAGASMELGNEPISIDAAGTPVVLTAVVGENGIAISIAPPVLGLEDALALTVYPNPSTDYFNVEMKSSSRIRLINPHGQVVIQKTFTRNIQLDVRDLKEGIYFLEVYTEGKRAFEKLIISN